MKIEIMSEYMEVPLLSLRALITTDLFFSYF